MKYKKHLSEPWFSLVKCKLKKIEGRLDKGEFKDMKVGDLIEFYNDDFTFKRTCIVKITKINNFKTFKEYLEKESLKKTLPGIESINNGLSIYFTYFTKKQEKQFKIKSLHLKLI